MSITLFPSVAYVSAPSSQNGLLGIKWIFSYRFAFHLSRRPATTIAEPLTALKNELLQKIVPELVDVLASALQDATPLHKVEEDLWDVLLRAGNQAMKALLDSHGSGDLGPTLTLPNGEQVNRLQELHTRQYVSIFGRFDLKRVAYGTRESQALAFVPLDNRLQLPESDFSYLLQDWDQELAVEQAFSKVNQTIERMLRLKQHTDCLELVLPFVRQRLPQVLQGQVTTVVRGLKRLAAKNKLNSVKKKSLARICGYLYKNRHRMRYDEYWSKGYPIASGVIEGACRHLVKDRLECAGMHWTLTGAQAMLDVGSVHIGGQWLAFQQFR